MHMCIFFTLHLLRCTELRNRNMDKLKESSSSRQCRIFKQVLISFAASWGSLGGGMSLSWTNVLVSNMVSDNTTFFRSEVSFTNTQMDLVGSMFVLGSMPGFLLGGWLVRVIGRRRSMMAASLPGIIGSLLIALAANKEMIYAGRFVEGIAYALVSLTVRPYIVEIADTDFRGRAVVTYNLMLQLGGISAVALGLAFSWYQVSFFSCGIYVVYCLILAPLLPESPTFLAITGKEKRAEAVLCRLRGDGVNVDTIMREIKEQNESIQGSGNWGFLLNPSLLKEVVILFGLFLISNFSGVEVIKANTTRILQSSGMALDNQISSILVMSILLCGNFAMMFLLDRAGRRRCLMISLAIVAGAYCLLGTYVFLTHPHESLVVDVIKANATVPYITEDVSTPGSNLVWIPLASLALAAFGQALGMGPLPWILSSEYFPTAIRSQTMCICTLFGSLMTFSAMQLFSPMQMLLTQAGLYWSYSCTAAIGIPYTYLLIRETKGKSVG